MRYTVYILGNAAGETLYVGVTWRWRNRCQQHAAHQPWWPEVSTVERIDVPDKPTARALETALIDSLFPIFNVLGRTLPRPWTGDGLAPRFAAPPIRHPQEAA